jgi:cell division protein FtsI/penicillin-binding protein 2
VRLHDDVTRDTMLRASLERRFSADPSIKFFTGGGIHTFENFDDKFQGVMNLRTAMRHSVNLVFVRLMRELVLHYTAELGYDQKAILADRKHVDRETLLRSAVDRESRQYLWSFHEEYDGLTYQEALRKLCGPGAAGLRRFAILYMRERPAATLAELERAAAQVLPQEATRYAACLTAYHHAHAGKERSLTDEAWLLKRHPLEVWLVQDRLRIPEANWLDLVERSAPARREAFEWVFSRRSVKAQNDRVRTQLERLAFDAIHEQWQQLGYSFDSLVPSLATALGSSADRPQALAELVGMLQNDGLRAPFRRIEALHFGTGTPYETRFEVSSASAERVMPSAVARVLKELLQDVVENGTGRRARHALRHADGTPIAVGGKTGTGDNRFERFDAQGRVISSRPVNRTASFVFFIGDRHYGMVSAYVPGPSSGDYTFTSALALQTFKTLAPAVEHLVAAPSQTALAASEFDEHVVTQPASELDEQVATQPAPPADGLVTARPSLAVDAVRSKY